MKPNIIKDSPAPASATLLTDEIHLLDCPAWIFDEKTLCITDANKKAMEFCMYEQHELIGLNITELWHDDDLVHILNDLFVHYNERSFFGSLKHKKKNGEMEMMRVRASRLSNLRSSWVVHLVPKKGGYN